VALAAGHLLRPPSEADGATLEQLVALTGWQTHTVRAALTRLRQRGLSVSLTEQDGRKRYRLSLTAVEAR